jgi:hypothetical protein
MHERNPDPLYRCVYVRYIVPGTRVTGTVCRTVLKNTVVSAKVVRVCRLFPPETPNQTAFEWVWRHFKQLTVLCVTAYRVCAMFGTVWYSVVQFGLVVYVAAVVCGPEELSR